MKNLDPVVTDAELEKIFGKFGKIHSSKIAKDIHGNSKGFGFVQLIQKNQLMMLLLQWTDPHLKERSCMFLNYSTISSHFLQFLLFHKPLLQFSFSLFG